jgi:hypothetical protein
LADQSKSNGEVKKEAYSGLRESEEEGEAGAAEKIHRRILAPYITVSSKTA